ncbi:MAG: hypothetical protein IKY83_11320 [Proteobacteria bacterium]|nr:hypothetical protein [Pseudomonadota bacterium]
MSITQRMTSFVFLFTALCAFVISYVCASQTELKAPRNMGADEYSVLPNKDALVWMSLGQQEFLADLIWIRALQYNNLKNEAHLAENFADAMIALDPQFKAVYRWVATAAVFSEDISAAGVERANHYLALGAQQFPLDPYYDYSIAINNISYYPETTPEKEAELRSEAITHLQIAMQKPDADPDITMLISGLLNDDDVSAKVRFLQQAVMTEENPETKRALQTRLILLSESSGSSALMISAKSSQYHRDHYEYLPPMLDFMLSAE